jgi:hypothetical protein
MARWYARQPTLLHPPASSAAPLYRLMPRVWLTDDLRAAIDELRTSPRADVAPGRDLHPFDADSLVLLPEATFQYLMTRVRPATRAYYQGWPTT